MKVHKGKQNTVLKNIVAALTENNVFKNEPVVFLLFDEEPLGTLPANIKVIEDPEESLSAGYYVLQVGNVPHDIFQYVYYNSDLPMIFEGQGTSSFAFATGKPYLQLSKNIKADNYPEGSIGKDDFGAERELCRKAAEELYKEESSDPDSGKYLKEFIQRIYANDEQDLLKDYFKALSRKYTEENDKLSVLLDTFTFQ